VRLFVVTLCDVGAASAIRPDGTVTVRESAGSAAGPGPGAARCKRLARLLLTDVTVTRTSGTITAHARLAGGQHRTLTLPVPDPAWKIRQTKASTIAEIDKLLDHHTCAEIAAILHSPAACPTARDGLSTPPWCSASSAPTSYPAAASGCSTPD